MLRRRPPAHYREPPRHHEREVYRRSPFAYLVDALVAFCMLGLAFPVLGGAVLVALHAATALGASAPLAHDDLARPFEWKELAIFGGCLLLGGAFVHYGGRFLIGIILPAVEVVATVEKRQASRGTRGTTYSVTIGGVTSDASKGLYQAVREGDQVRVKRLRGSHEVIRVVRADEPD